MKATGIVRGIDGLGRIVLPIDVRRERGIEPKDDLEIYVDGESIVLMKHRPACTFCGGHDELTGYKGKLVCRDCLRAIGGL